MTKVSLHNTKNANEYLMFYKPIFLHKQTFPKCLKLFISQAHNKIGYDMYNQSKNLW